MSDATNLRAHRPGQALQQRVPGLAEGVRSLAFIEAVMASSRADGRWTDLH